MYSIPFLNITEQMEALHTHPRTASTSENTIANRPAENTNRGVDIHWHEARNIDRRPEKPPIGSLYNGLAVRMADSKACYLVYNNQRHHLTEYTMGIMGFNVSMVVPFRRGKHHPITHRIMDNIPLGSPVPEEGIEIQISPSYVLRPLKSST